MLSCAAQGEASLICTKRAKKYHLSFFQIPKDQLDARVPILRGPSVLHLHSEGVPPAVQRHLHVGDEVDAAAPHDGRELWQRPAAVERLFRYSDA